MENQEEQARIQARTLQAPARDREEENEIRGEIGQDTPHLMKELIESMDRLVSQLEVSSDLKEKVQLLMKTGIISNIAQPSVEAQESRIPVEEESNWVESQRAILIGVAATIALMTTTYMVSPPGRVWQNAGNDPTFCTPLSPCISHVQPALFQEFIKNNCICFAFSMSVILLLFCGFRSHKKATVWIYKVLMCLILFFWSMAFYKAVSLVDSSSAVPPTSIDSRSLD